MYVFLYEFNKKTLKYNNTNVIIYNAKKNRK